MHFTVFLSYIDRRAGDDFVNGRDFLSNRQQIDLCINEISQGSEAALEKLYSEFRKPIFLFAMSILKNYPLAEDALQDTFLKIMASAKTYRLGTNPKAWIFSITRNVCVEFLKKSRMTLLDEEILETIVDERTAEDAVFDTLDSIECLAKLDSIEREIIVLYVFAGFKQTEIAKILGIPYIKVRSKYGYAAKKLKQHYAALSPPDRKEIVFNEK